jgi:cytochrome c oxidase assembly protein Cox11
VVPDTKRRLWWSITKGVFAGQGLGRTDRHRVECAQTARGSQAMTQDKLRKMTTDQLVNEFAASATRQGDALLQNNQSEVNRLYWRLDAIKDELQARPGDQRRGLLRLYDHPNAQVRLKAAKATLAIAPGAARNVLEMIKASKWEPQSLEAGMSLWNLDRGVFRPT